MKLGWCYQHHPENRRKKFCMTIDYRKNENSSIGRIIKIENFLEICENWDITVYHRISKKYTKQETERFWNQQQETTSKAISKYKLHQKFEFKGIEKRWKIKNRPALQKAVNTNLPILVSEITRLVGYKNPNKLPSKKLIRKFLSCYPNTIFVLVQTEKEIKTNRIRRGQEYTHNKGGGYHKPGYIKKRGTILKPIVWNLRFDERRGIREIERILEKHCHKIGMKPPSRQTISRWCK